MDHVSTAPPLKPAMMGLIEALRTSTTSAGLNVKATTGSTTVRLRYTAVLPPELLAHTVNIVRVRLTSAVPDNAPWLNERPAGKAGEIDHEVGVPQLTEGCRSRVVSLRTKVMS